MSLTVDTSSLAATCQQLELEWKDSLMSLSTTHECSRHNQHACQPSLSASCVSHKATVSASQCHRTTHVAESRLVETDTLLRQRLVSGCHDTVDDRRDAGASIDQDVMTNKPVDVCQQFVTSADVGCGSVYETCCGELQRLLSACLSLSHSTHHEHSQSL